MVNLLIADDNIYYAKSLVNFILSRDNNIRLINISTDGREAINNILNKSVDILILDLKMPKLSGIDILNILSDKELNKKPIIIVISEDIEQIAKIRNNSLVTCYISKTQGMNYIFNKIENIIMEFEFKNSNKELKNIIMNELIHLGYNLKHIGTTYLCEVICLACQIENPDMINNLEKYLYLKIANKYCKSIKTIKSNIIKATDCMYIEGNKNTIKEYFNFSYNYKPTPKVVITTLVSKIDKNIEI